MLSGVSLVRAGPGLRTTANAKTAVLPRLALGNGHQRAWDNVTGFLDEGFEFFLEVWRARGVASPAKDACDTLRDQKDLRQ
jgi:hypothetical protein